MENIMIIYDSAYQKLLYHKEIEAFEEIWKAESENLTDELYKEDFLALIEVGFRIPFNKVLIDHREFRFVITPELQIWHVENIFSISAQYVKGKTKVANLVSSDFFSQLSIEQTFDESTDTELFVSKYFQSREDAVKWLL
jgi:hypothetical protein